MGRRGGARLALNFVHTYTDRHGKLRRYYRKPGCKQIPLPGDVGSPEFMAAYSQACEMAAKEETTPKTRGAPGTFSRLIADYYQSTDFMRLKPSTAAVYSPHAR